LIRTTENLGPKRTECRERPPLPLYSPLPSLGHFFGAGAFFVGATATALEKVNEALEAQIAAGAAAALEAHTARNEQEAATTVLAPEKEVRSGRCVVGGGGAN
jgi:hypothetical protein